MGVYFIAAGTSSNNRNKSLEKSFTTSSLQKYLSREEYSLLLQSFNENEPVYLWGATEYSWRELKQVKRGEYVVDVKNKQVVQVFTFCFRIKGSFELQNYIGWDNQRKYDYVFFLKEPVGVKDEIDKNYFRNALGFTSRQWLPGQKYFSDDFIQQAMGRVGAETIEEFLGIEDTARKNISVKAIDEEMPEANYAASDKVTDTSTHYKSDKKDTDEQVSLWARFIFWLKRLLGIE